MGNKAIIVSRALHPPWNMGEVVLARNFVSILAKLYDDISISSTVDERRGPSNVFDSELRFRIEYYRNEKELRYAISRALDTEPLADFHIINASLVNFLGFVKKARKAFFYQFSYNILNNPELIARSIGALASTYLSNVRLLTTTFKSYSYLRSLFRRHYYYIPAPIDVPSYNEKSETVRLDDRLKILYLGHGHYLRFPYNEVLKAILRLEGEGYNVNLNAYVSELGYANYAEFTEGFKRSVEELGLEDIVNLRLRNLSEAEKWEVIRESDVVLFPSLVNTAIDPPLVILESMFMGKCVVATPVQSIPYLLGGGRGIIVKQRNLGASIYEVLRVLERNRALLRVYGARSEEWVRRNHSMDVVYDKMAGIIYGP